MSLFTIGNYTFSPKIKWASLAFIVIYIFCTLGFWQLHRAEEKRLMLKQHEYMQHTSPVLLSAKTLIKMKQNQPIEIYGTYDNQHVFFLDNQFYEHEMGYEVIQPVILSDSSKRVVLVSRGWVKAPTDRKKYPKLSFPKGPQHIHGVVYFPSKSILLGQNWDKNTVQDWPKRIEKIQFSSIRKWLDRPVYPFVLRLDPDEPNGYVRDWPIVNMPPERHMGYAVQWFAMAAAIFIIFIILSVKKKHAKKR